MRRFAALCLLASLGACASGSDRPLSAAAMLPGQAFDVKAANGQLSTLRFAQGGAVSALFGGREVAGRWAMEDDQLCFTWAGNFRECWPYADPLRSGETRTITSSRGNKVEVTAR